MQMESVAVNISVYSKTRNVTVSMVSDYDMMAGHVKVGTMYNITFKLHNIVI